MTLRDRAIQIGLAAAKRVAGRCVTYAGKRNGQPFSVAVTSIRSTSIHDAVTEDGFTTTFKTHDELIDVCDLFTGRDRIVPQDGDTITERVDGKDVKHTVTMPDGSQVYSYSDPAQTRYRISTTQGK